MILAQVKFEPTKNRTSKKRKNGTYICILACAVGLIWSYPVGGPTPES